MKKKLYIIIFIVLYILCSCEEKNKSVETEETNEIKYMPEVAKARFIDESENNHLKINANDLWEKAENASYGKTFILNEGNPIRLFSDDLSKIDKYFLFYSDETGRKYLKTTLGDNISLESIPVFSYIFSYGNTIIGKTENDNIYSKPEYIQIEVNETVIKNVVSLDGSKCTYPFPYLPTILGIQGFPQASGRIAFYEGKNVQGEEKGNVVFDSFVIHYMNNFEIKEIIGEDKNPFNLYSPEIRPSGENIYIQSVPLYDDK